MTMSGTLDRRGGLDERFRGERSWREGTRDGVPAWYSQLLTELILATGDDEIRYFSAKYVPDRDGARGSMAVVAFTGELVVYANLDNDPLSGTSPLEVIVTARRALSSFSIESVDAHEDADPLASARISVNYPEFSRTLPLGESDWANRGSETAELIAQLRRDVVA